MLIFFQAIGIAHNAVKATLLVVTNATDVGSTKIPDKTATTRPEEVISGFAQNAEQQTDPDNEIVTNASRVLKTEGAREEAVEVLEEGAVEVLEERAVEVLEEGAVEVLHEGAGAPEEMAVAVMEALVKEVVVIVAIKGRWTTSTN